MKYAFLGAGKMALALAQGMLRAKVCTASNLVVSSRSKAGLKSFIAATSARAAVSNEAAAKAADVVLLCVKPGDAIKALAETQGALKGKTLISVVTGLKLARLQQAAAGARVVRAMPNTAAMVGCSASALVVPEKTPRTVLKVAERVFQAVGEVYWVAEGQMDAVTGVSGSGPAYIYMVMEALSDGGVAAGLPRKLAQDLALRTVLGAAQTAVQSGEHPAVLREMVTSPGGTTIAALGALEKAAVRSAFIDAVKAAAKRSKELSGD